MINFKITKKPKFPKIKLDKDLAFIAKRFVIPEIAGHIQERKDITGKKYQPLEASTIKAKGHSDPLIGKERRLFSSAIYQMISKGAGKMIIRIKASRREVAKILQNEGVKSKKFGRRKFNFFVVSKEAEKKAVIHIRNRINKVLKSA